MRGVPFPGLVHEVVPEAELIDRAMQRAKALAAMPPFGVRQVKASLRRPVADAVRSRRSAESQSWLDSWFSPGGQKTLRAAIERLKRK